MLPSKPSFNLRREANPLATIESLKRTIQDLLVSISGEKPIPWRRKWNSYENVRQ